MFVCFSETIISQSLCLIGWKKKQNNLALLYFLCVFLRELLTHNCPLTHTNSHGFPCSGLGPVSSYFLFWLQAVSFFRSCIYTLGMLTSFAQQFINSLSTPFPEKSVFTAQAKHHFIQLLFGFSSPYLFQRRALLRGITQSSSFCLISSQGIILVS